VALFLSMLSSTAAWPLSISRGFPALQQEVLMATTTAPGVSGYVHRLETRAERSMDRFGGLFWDVSLMWLWALWSSGLFLLVSAVSSVADVRMLRLRRQGPAALSRYFGHGTRMFFRLVRDRRTPYMPRIVLLLALLYWLVPIDLIPDASVVPGFADDLVIAIVAAKTFMYLCPDALVQGHADAVEAEARA
jgi:uncharacterized membrane protein YkvA (DUF1232 family)